jgi:chaperonin GroES
MNLQPTFGRIIIRPDAENDSKTIHIPDALRKCANQGEVIAVGPGRRHIDGKVYPSSLKLGERVIFNLQQAFPFEDGGTKLFICEDENVLCVVGTSAAEN